MDTKAQPDYWLISDRVLVRKSGSITLDVMPRAVGITREKISHLEPASALRSGPLFEQAIRESVEILDQGNNPVVPAFVNAHTHLALAPLRGIASFGAQRGNVVTDVFFRVESEMSADDVRAFARMGAFESILCGGLFVWDHFYYGQALAEALFEVGLSGVIAPTLQDVSGPFVCALEAQLQATEWIENSGMMRERGIYAAFGPHAGDTVSLALFKEIGEQARRLQLPVHLHLAQAASEMEVLFGRNGMAIEQIAEALDQCSVSMAHGLFLNRGQVEHLVTRRWTLLLCPYSQMQFGFLGPFDAWMENQGRWALGTDCVASNDALDVQRELALLAGHASLRTSFSREREDLLSGVGEEEQLYHARRVEQKRRDCLDKGGAMEADFLLAGAMGTHLEDGKMPRAGEIKVGALANLLVLDSTHPTLYPDCDLPRSLAYGSTAGAIKWGIIAGKRRGERDGWLREWIGSDHYLDCLDEARRRRRELIERAFGNDIS